MGLEIINLTLLLLFRVQALLQVYDKRISVKYMFKTRNIDLNPNRSKQWQRPN